MRLIMLLPLVSLLVLAGCQTIADLPREQQEVVSVHEVAGKSALMIYSRTLEWFATNVRDSKSSLEIQDKETGIIMGKIRLNTGATTVIGTGMPMLVAIKVEVKDGKYRSTFFGFTLPDRSFDQNPAVGIELDSVKKSAAQLDASLAEFISAKAKADF